MSTSDTSSDQPKRPAGLAQLPGRGLRALGYQRRRFMIGLRNGLRRLRRARLDYVVMTLGGPLPERDAPPRRFYQRFLPLPPPPLSLQTLNSRLRRIAEAGNVRGVLFIFTGFGAGLATLQNLRRAMLRLRAAGKEVIVFTTDLDLAHYYVATAADRIITPAGSTFNVLGLRSEAIFLKDALAQLGIYADIIQISPFKTAGNILGKAEITPEQQAQLDWLLDDNYDQITADMATGRGLSQAALQALIDHAPYTPQQALDHGLIDHIAYEDELAALLAPAGNGKSAKPASAKQKPPLARLRPWSQARKSLREVPYRLPNRFIGVISLEGTIAPGPSRQSPIDLPIVGGATAGEETIVQLLRQATQMPGMAALILHVDSPGGVALSADLMWRELQQFAQHKPLLIYMGNIAASGGYYVAAAGHHIMSQPGTVTGSIGVITARLNSDGLYQKLHINRTVLTRGQRANLFSDHGPLDEAERQAFWDSILFTYDRFKALVAEGRGLPLASLDPICEGRVWTGRQALGHKLVDSHGDFVDALEQAAKMAGLPSGAGYRLPVLDLHPAGGERLLPQPYEATQELLHLLQGQHLRAWQGQPLLLLPYHLRWR